MILPVLKVANGGIGEEKVGLHMAEMQGNTLGKDHMEVTNKARNSIQES